MRLIIIMLVLTGCASGIHDKALTIRSDVDLRVVLYSDVKSLHAAYEARGGMAKKRERAYGFAVIHGNVCELHLMELRAEHGPVITDWGHELSHCVYGDWHG